MAAWMKEMQFFQGESLTHVFSCLSAREGGECGTPGETGVMQRIWKDRHLR